MDDIIFEDPSKQLSYCKKSPRVPSTEEKAAQDGLIDSQQQERIQSQSHNDPDPLAIRPIALELSAASTNRHNNQQLRGNNDTKDNDDTADDGLPSLHDLFSLSEDDGHSTDNDSHASVDDLFSLVEQNGQSSNSDTGLKSVFKKRRKKIPRDHSTTSDRRRRGDNQSEPIILEDDSSDGGPVTRFKFRKRKPESKLGGFDSRIPLLLVELGEVDSIKAGGESQGSDEDVDGHHSTPTTRQRYQHSGRTRAEERNDDDDESNAVGVRGANRQAVLSPLRRGVKDTAHQTSPQSKKRQRPASSKSSLNNPSNGLTFSGKRKTSPNTVHKSSRVDSILNSRSESHLIAKKSSRGTQEIECPPNSGPRDILSDPDESQHELEEQVVWEHGPLLAYEVRNGKPRVFVPWRPTWERPEEYSKKEVDRVKRQYETQVRRKGRKGCVGKRTVAHLR